MRLIPLLTMLLALAPGRGAAQSGASLNLPDLSGTWQATTADGVQRIVVRADSSLSFGDELVRWRLAADTVYLALGGEWVGYRYALRGSTLTLSGGDLLDPIRLSRVGPATPRPEGVPLPPAPAAKPTPAR